MEHYKIESYIDRLRATFFTKADFYFDENLDQRNIARRIVITMEGEKKVNENSIVEIKILYALQNP